jgi:hypothetical protein
MSIKFALQALTLAGFLAASSLPALAAEMTPAAPAPGTAIQSGTNAKMGAEIAPKAKRDAKSAKKTVKEGKETKKHVQSAKLPPVPGESNTGTGTPAQH